MPIISQGIPVPLNTRMVSSESSRKNISGAAENKLSEVEEKLMSVNHSHNVLCSASDVTSNEDINKGIWHYFMRYLSRIKGETSPEIRALNNILEEGQILHQEGMRLSEELQLANTPSPPAFSLKSKVGFLMGVVLVLTGSGVGLYFRRESMSKNSNDFSTDNRVDNINTKIASSFMNHDPYYAYNKKEEKKSKIAVSNKVKKSVVLCDEKKPCTLESKQKDISTAATLTQCNNENLYQGCQTTDIDPRSHQKGNIVSRIVVNINGNWCLCPLSNEKPREASSPASGKEINKLILSKEKYKTPPILSGVDKIGFVEKNSVNQYDAMNKKESSDEEILDVAEQGNSEGTSLETDLCTLKINSCQTNALIIQQIRNRLVGYINAHTSVPINAKNKDLARLILFLIIQEPSHEVRLAKIYLYGTGFFGERNDEYIGLNLQRQLVGDLLSNLLYGKSLDNYLIDVFSRNRYVSVEGFRRKIVEHNFPFDGEQLFYEMRFFYERYVMPIMPILYLKSNIYSEVIVGSINWFLIYLSADRDWLESDKYNEKDHVTRGFNILNDFLKGELDESYRIRIEMGFKFCALYLDPSLMPDNMMAFNDLFDIFMNEFVSRVNLSSYMVLKSKEVVDGMSRIENKPWYSKKIFANDLLMKFCASENPSIFFINKPDGVNKVMTQPITKQDFINSKKEPAWCNKIHKGKIVMIKIPTVKYAYEKLFNDSLAIINQMKEFLIENMFVKHDYLNPYMEGDDFSFINKSALEVVSVKINEPRNIYETRIGPPLKKINIKEKYLFFRASSQGTERIYAIDLSFQELIRRVKTEKNNLKENVGVFFDGWSSYANNLLNLSVYRNDTINISSSEKEPYMIFIKKIIQYEEKKVRSYIKNNQPEDLDLKEETIRFLKEIFIPFYSCVTSLQGDDATEAFTSCLLDGIFLVFPAGKKIIGTTSKATDTVAEMIFSLKKNNFFKTSGSILWGKLINDIHIYNTISNERAMLRSLVFNLLMDSIDPGFGLIKDISINALSNIIKGNMMRLPLVMIKNFKNVAELGVRAKSIFDFSRKISIKLSIPSGKLFNSYNHFYSLNSRFSPSLYGSAYYGSNYYAYFLTGDNVDLLLGITDDTTQKGENIYVVLSEDEVNGIIFRCTLEATPLNTYKIIPWIPTEVNAKKKIYSNNRTSLIENKVIISSDYENQFDNLIYYPECYCLLSEDGISQEKAFTIFKINNIYYHL